MPPFPPCPPAGLEQAGNEALSLSLSPTHAHTPTRPWAVTLVFHSQRVLGSSKASGLFSKAKAWPAASPWQGTNSLGRHFPKAQLIPGSCSDFSPRSAASQPLSCGHQESQEGGPKGGEEAGGYQDTPLGV